MISTAPTVPRNVRLEGRTSTAITLSWEKPLLPPGVIGVYRIAYWKERSEDSHVVRKTGIEVRSEEDEIEATIEDLDPDTTYKFEVMNKSS